MNYARQSVSNFISGFLLKTPEGWLCVGGSVLCVVWGLLLWFAPSAVPQPRSSVQGLALGFVFMPLLLLAVLLSFAQPAFRPSLLTTTVMLVTTGLPFYVAYLR
jgi:hypothetical protein